MPSAAGTTLTALVVCYFVEELFSRIAADFVSAVKRETLKPGEPLSLSTHMFVGRQWAHVHVMEHDRVDGLCKQCGSHTAELSFCILNLSPVNHVQRTQFVL